MRYFIQIFFFISLFGIIPFCLNLTELKYFIHEAVISLSLFCIEKMENHIE